MVKDKATILLLSAVILTCLLSFVGAALAHADVVSQLDPSYVVASGDSNVNFYTGTTTTDTSLSAVSIFLGKGSLVGQVQLQFTCFANTWNTSQSGCSTGAALQSTNLVSASSTGAYTFYFANTVLQSGKQYLVEIVSLHGGAVDVYGTNTYQFVNQCNFAGFGSQCSGTPYVLYNAAPNWDAVVVNPPPLLSGASAALLASTSALYSDISFASSTVQCTSGNFLSNAFCAAGVFLFVPNPAALNAFLSIPATAGSRFPFSWIYGVSSEFNSLAVSSSSAMTSLSYNFHDLGIGSTTPLGNILPDVDVFSKNTIETYISPGLWATFQTLIASGMWLSFFFFEFNRARRMAAKH